jgi:hypothetical protein
MSRPGGPDGRISAVLVDADDPAVERDRVSPAGLGGWGWGVLRPAQRAARPGAALLGPAGGGLQLFHEHFASFRPLGTATTLGTAAGLHDLVLGALAARVKVGILRRGRAGRRAARAAYRRRWVLPARFAYPGSWTAGLQGSHRAVAARETREQLLAGVRQIVLLESGKLLAVDPREDHVGQVSDRPAMAASWCRAYGRRRGSLAAACRRSGGTGGGCAVSKNQPPRRRHQVRSEASRQRHGRCTGPRTG